MTKEKIGTTFSIISIVNNLGVILASYAGAIMLDYLNVITVTIISIIIFLLSIVPLDKDVEDVSYDGHLLLNNDKIRIGRNCDIKKLVEEHYKSIFFHKHEDWKMEDERRLLMIGSEQKLHIDGCIKRISLGNKFVNDKYLMLKLVNYMISREYSCFKQIHPHSFTECVNDESGYEEMEVCHVLYNILNDIKNRSSAILDWENQEDFVIDPICFE